MWVIEFSFLQFLRTEGQEFSNLKEQWTKSSPFRKCVPIPDSNKGAHKNLVRIPTLPFTKHVTLGNLINFPEP